MDPYWCGRNAGMRSPPSNKVSPQLVCTFTASYDSLTAFHISHDYTNLCHDITTCSNQLQNFYSDSAIKPLQLSTQLVIVIRMLLWLNITTIILYDIQILMFLDISRETEIGINISGNTK